MAKMTVKNPIEQILDENNTENVILYDAENKPIEFEQVALIPLERTGKLYAIMIPVTPMQGVNEGEGVLFVLDELKGDIEIERDDAIIDEVLTIYKTLIEEGEVQDKNVSNMIDDIIYPLYIPTGTVLVSQEKVSKEDGERIILTFDGEKPFLLVEETSSVDEDFSVIPIFGEPDFLNDTVGAITDNSISWSSNGIDYYLVSDVMGRVELVEIANSISSIPVMK